MSSSPRLIKATANGPAIQTQGYTKGNTRGSTIVYGNPQVGNSLSPSSSWLQVVSSNLAASGGGIAGAARRPDSRVTTQFLAINQSGVIKNQKLISALSATPSQLFTGAAGIQSSMAAPGSATIDFGVVRAGHYIIMGANINVAASASNGGINTTTYTLANTKNALAVLAGGSDTSGRVSVHNRYGGNETKAKAYLMALVYSGGPLDQQGYTYPVLLTQYTDGLVVALDSLPSGTNNVPFSGVAGLSGIVSNEAVSTNNQALWVISSNLAATTTTARTQDKAIGTLTIPGRICFSINGKVPITQTYSIGAAMGGFTEDTVW
jgi:hypothetical protein